MENQLKKLERIDSIYFRGKGHFEDDGAQNWLVLQPIDRYFKTVSSSNSNILSWKSKDCPRKVLSLLLHLIKFLILR